jgi:tetratricopeptide (TPR) repeat protein
MSTKITISLIIALVFSYLSSCPTLNSTPRPLTRSELLALVVGEVLPENLTADIRSNGLSFTPDESYKALLKSAGAGPKVLASLEKAKISPASNEDSRGDAELLRHLSLAGKLISQNQLEEAVKELTATPSGTQPRSDTGFVVGYILLCENRAEEAGEVYSEILRRDPDFPELHTRLSATYFQTGNPEETLREAKAAIALNPDNPAAHLNAGLSLVALRNFDAGKSEFQESIRSKPDYALAYFAMGNLLNDQREVDAAIAQFKKALVLDPTLDTARYNLGIAYTEKGDYVSAIREYREVKRRDPVRVDTRQNLGEALLHVDPAAAVTEFRELAAVAPDFQECHECLAGAFAQTGQLEEAKKEYSIAAQLDPASPGPHSGFGHLLEVENKYDEALEEYRKAEVLEQGRVDSFIDAGRVLLFKKDFPGAISELKRAEEIDPTSWYEHDLRGQAFEGSGDRSAAIGEYKESISIAPKELQARLDLALALEKQGDWVGALDNYRQASVDEPAPKIGVAQPRFDAQNKYQSAQTRFRHHLADLRASGKSSEADALEAGLRGAKSAPKLDDQFHTAMQTVTQAVGERRFNDAETSAKLAVGIAEKIQPEDGRLPEAVGALGSVYAWRLDYEKAEVMFKRQLLLSEKLYGPQSPMIAPALQNLAMTALARKDSAGAIALFRRSVDLNEKTYGENSEATATSLIGLAHVYSMQQDFGGSETTLVQVLHIYETMYGAENTRLAVPLTSLCYVYDQWGKPEKSEPCHARLVALAETQFGANSPNLVRDLTAEADALRKLGRPEEAAKLELRTQAIQSAQANSN